MTDPPAGQGSELAAAVASFIDEHSLIRPRAGVVVGVSGGADSVALLGILRELAARGERDYRLTAAHMHHGLRESADADELFVRKLAGKWQIPLVCARRDVSAAARADAQSIEAAGRRLRYEFLTKAAVELGAACVAVGHHADDNVETVLQRIIRGTHLHGLAGIPPSRPLGGSPVMLVRPLLRVRRREIEDHCRHAGLDWRTDPTNEDRSFGRNFIRHELLALLRERLNPRVDEAVLRLATAAADADAYLAGRAREILKDAERPAPEGTLALDGDALAGRPRVIQTCALRIALERLGMPMRRLDAEKLDELAALLGPDGPGAVALPGGYIARREGAALVVGRSQAPAPPVQTGPLELQCPGCTTLADGRTVTCTVQPMDREAFEAHCRAPGAGVELLDAEKVCGRLTCRARRDGDGFVPLGSPGRQSVGDFLTNIKASRKLRDRVLCICDERGIVHLAPYRIEDRVKVAHDTRTLLRIEIAG